MKTRLILLAVIVAGVAFSKKSFSSLTGSVNERNVAVKEITKHSIKTNNYSSRFIFTSTAYPGVATTWLPGTTVATSNSGNFHLVYQNDGNLVLCDNYGTAYWASGPQVSSPHELDIWLDGRIGLYKNNGGLTFPEYWISGYGFSTPTNFFWVLQDDGNFVRYGGHSGAIDWSITPRSTGTGGGIRSSHFNTIQ